MILQRNRTGRFEADTPQGSAVLPTSHPFPIPPSSHRPGTRSIESAAHFPQKGTSSDRRRRRSRVALSQSRIEPPDSIHRYPFHPPPPTSIRDLNPTPHPTPTPTNTHTDVRQEAFPPAGALRPPRGARLRCVSPPLDQESMPGHWATAVGLRGIRFTRPTAIPHPTLD